jgi:cytidylate kinase
MYRAVTWLALRRGVPVGDRQALASLASRATIEVRDAPASSAEQTAVIIEGEDATPYLRDPDVEANVSLVSRVPEVRVALVQVQRNLAAHGPIVMAGRDIGSVVLPGASLKVYLDASPAVRARRRAAQLRAAGFDADERALTDEIARRDAIDSTREASPLTAAEGAVIVHTDDMTLQEVVQRIVELAS